MYNRVILHVDLDSFFASVECFYNPDIRESPVAVCGDPELRHGIVLARNTIAKQYGVQTGETIASAKRKCPFLVLVPPHQNQYDKYSRLAREIYCEYTDYVEEFGIDECWLDISNLAPTIEDGVKIAEEIKETIYYRLGITCSIGVSYNKIFAKLASELFKPNGIAVIPRENYKKIWRLPAIDMMYIGWGIMRKLFKQGIRTIGDLANTDSLKLYDMFGLPGLYFHQYANGEDTSRVRHKNAPEKVRSIGRNHTAMRDLVNMEDVTKVIYMLSESVASQLRTYGYKSKSIQVYIRETDLKEKVRQGSFYEPSNNTKDIIEKALEIFKTKHTFTKPLRTLGVRGYNLFPANNDQLSLFDDIENTKEAMLEKAMDEIRFKYGYEIIKRAIVLDDKELTNIHADYDRSTHRIGYYNKS